MRFAAKPGATHEKSFAALPFRYRFLSGAPASCANGGTIGFACDSPEKVKAFHDAGVANGGKTCEDPPGPRGKLYLAYLRDPDGNKLCALCRS